MPRDGAAMSTQAERPGPDLLGRPATDEPGDAGTAEHAGGPVTDRPADHAVDHAMRGLFGRDAIYMVLWVLQLLGAALVTPVLTRALSISEFGGVASSNAVMQVLFVFATCGFQVAIQRRFADHGGTAAATGLLTVSMGIAALSTAVATATGPWWSAALGFTDFQGSLRLAVLWAGTSAVTGSALGLLRSQDRLGAFASVNLLQSVVAEVTSLVLVLVVRADAEMFVLGQVLAQVAAMTLALALTRPRRLGRQDRALVRSGLAFALPLVPAMLGALVLATADRLVTQAQLGSDAVARYQVAYNIGTLPILVLGALDSTWLPRIFAVEDGAHREAVLNASRDALYRLLAPVIIGLSLGAPLVLRIWAPADFRTDELVLLTTLLVLSAVPFAAVLSSRRRLLAHSATVDVAAATIVAALANVALNLVLVPRFGLIGGALTALLCYGLQHVIMLARGRRGRAERTARGTGFLQTVLACGVALATVLLPVDVDGLVLRTALGLGCLAWLGLAARRITTTSGRHRRG